jgi:predicted dienelactone hydrolase
MRVDFWMNLPMTALLPLLGSVMAMAAEPDAYDPLKVPEVKVLSKTLVVHDMKRSRDLPLRVYLPASPKPAPVILFSHGLGGSCDNNPYLGNHWAKRGYLVVFVQHPGSDENVWMDVPVLQRMSAMKKAASFENFLARAGDIPAVIDALSKWNLEAAHPLQGRLDPARIGMSGHSFGANTTQAVSGQSFAGQRVSFVEPRIDAAVMMSPGPPAAGDPAAAFSTIRIPCLLLTGTRDDSPISNMTAADRLKVFPHLQKAAAWQVVFHEATHMEFGERDLMGKRLKDPRYHRAILALTTAFWDAELKGDPKAKEWLQGGGAKSVLVPEDRWMMNPKAAG